MFKGKKMRKEKRMSKGKKNENMEFIIPANKMLKVVVFIALGSGCNWDPWESLQTVGQVR